MKRLFVAAVASLALLVAAPVASATPNLPPQAPSFTSVSCTLVADGTTQHFSFRLPAQAVPWFQQALARVQLNFPGLSCTFS
jgi:hypothetical protein